MTLDHPAIAEIGRVLRKNRLYAVGLVFDGRGEEVVFVRARGEFARTTDTGRRALLAQVGRALVEAAEGPLVTARAKKLSDRASRRTRSGSPGPRRSS